jgi:hypothetical protein
LRIIYQDLSYDGNLKRAEQETLHDRRTMLCEKLFSNVIANPQHKLAELLPIKNINSYTYTESGDTDCFWQAWGRLYKTLNHFFNHYFVVK